MLERLFCSDTAFGVSTVCISDVARRGTGEPRMATLLAVRPTIVRVCGFGSGIKPSSAAPS